MGSPGKTWNLNQFFWWKHVTSLANHPHKLLGESTATCCKLNLSIKLKKKLPRKTLLYFCARKNSYILKEMSDLVHSLSP